MRGFRIKLSCYQNFSVRTAFRLSHSIELRPPPKKKGKGERTKLQFRKILTLPTNCYKTKAKNLAHSSWKIGCNYNFCMYITESKEFFQFVLQASFAKETYENDSESLRSKTKKNCVDVITKPKGST